MPECFTDWAPDYFTEFSRESSSTSTFEDEIYSTTEDAAELVGIEIRVEVWLSLREELTSFFIFIESSKGEVYPLTVVAACLSVEFSLDEDELPLFYSGF